MKLLAATLMLLAASPALADAAGDFRAGRWADTISEGRREATADSLVLAGRAQLVIAGYQVRDKAVALAQVERAEKDFDAALAKAPADIDAQLQKAIAIGFRAKLTKGIGLGKDTKRRFEAIRARRPADPLVWAAIGGWHGGAVATVGSFIAGSVLGAKKAEVDRCFGEALKLAPTNPAYRTLYAMTLLDLDTDNGGKAAAVLKGIGQLPAADAYEALIRAQGAQIAAKLAAGDAKGAQVLARKLQAFGGL